MKNFFTFLLLLAAFRSLAEANYVYHEASLNAIGCNGEQYRTMMQPNPIQSMSIAFKIEYQFFWNQARIYYTTDGSTPGGAFGGSLVGTTQVVTANYVCGFSSGGNIAEVVKGTIPANPGGSTIKYIVSAWHSGGGDEIFGNGCGNCGTENRPYTAATVFDFVVLPVEMIHFNARKGEKSTILDWATASEINNDRFAVERSSGGQTDWREIGSVAGKGSTSEPQSYRFEDREPLAGLNFYRLRQVDFDGKWENSPVRSVDFRAKKAATVAPSPASDFLKIDFETEKAEAGKIQIADPAGRIVFEKAFDAEKGHNSLTINELALPSGLFILQVLGEKSPLADPIRLVIQR